MEVGTPGARGLQVTRGPGQPREQRTPSAKAGGQVAKLVAWGEGGSLPPGPAVLWVPRCHPWLAPCPPLGLALGPGTLAPNVWDGHAAHTDSAHRHSEPGP